MLMEQRIDGLSIHEKDELSKKWTLFIPKIKQSTNKHKKNIIKQWIACDFC